MRIPLISILLAASSLFATASFAAPKYLSGFESYLWEENETQTGRFVLRLIGDGGSRVTVNYQFIGFYLGYSYGTLDKLIPKKTNIKMSGVIRSVSGKTERLEEFQLRSQIYSNVPTRKNSDKYSAPFEINWEAGRSPRLLATGFSVDQGMLTPRFGGVTKTHPANYTGTITTTREYEDGTCQIDQTESAGIGLSFRAGDVETERPNSLTSVVIPSVVPKATKIEDGYQFTYQIADQFDRDGGTADSHCIVEDGDKSVSVNMTLDVQFPQENEFLLSPMIYETETKWLPTPGDIRFYRLGLRKVFGEIEAIRFGLDEVSQYPGVATNAGYYKHCMISPMVDDEERWETDGVISDGTELQCPDLGEDLRFQGEVLVEDPVPYTSPDTGVTHTTFSHIPLEGTIAWKNRRKYSVPTKFPRTTPLLWYSFDRWYTTFKKSPIDDMPDVFFRDDDMEEITKMHTTLEYTLVDPKHYDAKKGYNYSDKVEVVEHPSQFGQETIRRWRPAHYVFVRIMDYGASARLFAEVKVDGEWQRATAWGSNADADEEYLLIPNDKNRDGIQDQWARDHGVKDSMEDLDTHDAAKYLGDGLTAFEEYRGLIFSKNDRSGTDPETTNQLRYSAPSDSDILSHHRTDTSKKQIFVHTFKNYVQAMWEGSNSTRRGYKRSGVELVKLEEDEFEDEIVNYNETRYSLGSQYAIVAMTLDQLARISYGDPRKLDEDWENIGGIAHGVNPPRKGKNTVVIKTTAKQLARTYGHEIGHKLSISHPGDRDIQWALGSDFTNLAVKHGQHSGNVQSFMRYRVASHFCDEPPNLFEVFEELYEELGLPAVPTWPRTDNPLEHIPIYLIRELSIALQELVLCNISGVLGHPRKWPEHPWQTGSNFILSQDGQGTGVNSDDAWAGDASSGGDLPQLNVKSY